MAIKSAAGMPLPATSPSVMASRFSASDEVVVIAADFASRLVERVELVARDLRGLRGKKLSCTWRARSSSFLTLLGQEQFVQLHVLHGHRRLIRHAPQ